jgi:hypothetical protein
MRVPDPVISVDSVDTPEEGKKDNTKPLIPDYNCTIH